MVSSRTNKETLEELLKRFDCGESVVDLATSLGLHPTTIRRYLRKSGRKLARASHTNLLGNNVKLKLRKVLTEQGVGNIDILISELDKNFIIENRQEDEEEVFKVIDL